MKITFEVKPLNIGARQIIVVPLRTSLDLPSRGMVMVHGMINRIPFNVALEPDGKGSHWFEISQELRVDAKLENGRPADLMIEPLEEWMEPEIPKDMMDEIEKANLLDPWGSLTTRARWDWLRWIRSTANPETRQKRIHVACSKLKDGETNPCCFNRTQCTITDVSKSGVLLEK